MEDGQNSDYHISLEPSSMGRRSASRGPKASVQLYRRMSAGQPSGQLLRQAESISESRPVVPRAPTPKRLARFAQGNFASFTSSSSPASARPQKSPNPSLLRRRLPPVRASAADRRGSRAAGPLSRPGSRHPTGEAPPLSPPLPWNPSRLTNFLLFPLSLLGALLIPVFQALA